LASAAEGSISIRNRIASSDCAIPMKGKRLGKAIKRQSLRRISL
jgi:hypothetical protein